MAWPEVAAGLDWLPLGSLLLAADGGALAVSPGWSALSGLGAEDSRADGWTSAVEPLDRGVLRARLRDAAAAGRAGHADARLAGRPAGRWSRWWWRPGPSGRLVACVADLGDLRARDGQRGRRPAGRLVRRGEFVNLAGRALRRSGHHGGHVAVVALRLDRVAGPGAARRAAAERVSAAAGPAGAAAEVAPGEYVILLDGLNAPGDAAVIAGQVRDAVTAAAGGAPARVTAVSGVAVAAGPGDGAEELIGRALRAARPAGYAPGPGPRPAVGPALAAALAQRLLYAGLAVQSASALAGAQAASRLQQVLDQLDAIIGDTRTAAFESQAPQHRDDSEDQ